MPPTLPDRLEAGTHNMPGIAGLLEGLRFVRRRTPGGHRLPGAAAGGGGGAPPEGPAGVEVFTPQTAPIPPVWCPSGRRAGTAKSWRRRWDAGVSPCGRGFTVRRWPTARRGHWTPGTVRLSLSDFNTPAQIEKLAQELHQLFRETVR